MRAKRRKAEEKAMREALIKAEGAGTRLIDLGRSHLAKLFEDAAEGIARAEASVRELEDLGL